MAELVYLVCAIASLFCAGLLLRSYLRQRTRLALWSTVCFAGLALNNVLLVVDLIVVPHAVDLSLVRTATALASMVVLVVGLIWEAS